MSKMVSFSSRFKNICISSLFLTSRFSEATTQVALMINTCVDDYKKFRLNNIKYVDQVLQKNEYGKHDQFLC
jgi:hypothetical protein